jgi:hypothetical protein
MLKKTLLHRASALVGALALTASVGAASIGTLTIDGGAPMDIDSFVVNANGTVAITVTTTDTGGGGTDPTTYTVSTGRSPSAGGTITPSAPQQVNEGSTVGFIVTPNSGYRIKNIQGTCGGTRDGNNYTTKVINGDCNVWVNFEPVPGGDGGLGDCGTTPANVEVAATFDIYNGGSTTTHNLNDQIKAFPFTTNGSTTARGQLNTAYTANSPSVRTTWISNCPGDSIEVARSEVGVYCTTEGYENTVLRYGQDAFTYQCQLQPNTTYYFNVKNARLNDMNTSSCTGSNCPFYRAASVTAN